MGNEQQGGENFNHKEWTQLSTNPNLITLWQNNHNRNIHIEQHRIYTVDQEQFVHERQLYFQRKNHPYWVAAYYFQEEKSTEICVSRSIAHIFIEKIPIKIFDLRDLPFPDLIHAYSQCLQGYKTLAHSLGCFRVSGQFIGVSQKGVVKVWAGTQWSQIGIGIAGNRITQEQMVRSIVECLQSCNENLANQQIPNVSIKNFLYRNTDRLSFDQAIHQLKNFALEFNYGFIPNRLESLYNTQNFQMFLDPLLRSNHNLEQSKYISNPQSTNAQATFRKVDSGQIINAFGNNKQLKDKEKKRPSFAFFSCMNDQQRLKNSKLVTQQEALNLYIGNTQSNQATVQRAPVNPPPAPPIQPSFAQTQVAPAPILGSTRTYSQHFAENNQQNKYIPNQPNHSPALFEQRPVQRRMLVPAPSQPNLNSSIHFQYNLGASNQLSNHIHNQSPPPQPVFHQPLNTHHQNHTFGNPNMNHFHSVNPINRVPPTLQINQKQVQNESDRRKRPIPESIIMQLYTSQDKYAGQDHLPPIKSFGLVKQSASEMEQPQNQLRFDSATLIKDGQPNSLTGVPNNNHFPHTNTNLKSIQELSSQHWKHDNVSYTSTPSRPPSELQSPWGISQIKRYDTSKFQSRNNSNYFLDLNDGKTPDALLKSIKQLRNVQSYEQFPQKIFR